MTATIFAVPNWTDKLGLAFTGVLALVGIVGIIVAICTLKIIERQTTATGTAANAALRNAQAVINAERPWIVVNVQENSESKQVFTFRIVNKGRTPAKFISGTYDHIFADSMDTLAEMIPQTPVYKGTPIHPNNSLVIQDGYFDVDPPIIPMGIMSNPNQILFFYGQIVYDDVLGKTRPDPARHETRWCFYYAFGGPGFTRNGPKEYEDYT